MATSVGHLKNCIPKENTPQKYINENAKVHVGIALEEGPAISTISHRDNIEQETLASGKTKLG